MALLIIVAFVAGLVTAVSPCVLPILPIVLATGADGDRRRPYLVIVGLIASFAFFTLASVQIISALHLPDSALRDVAIAVIAVFGLTLLVPALSRGFERLTGRLTAAGASLMQRGTPSGGLAAAGTNGVGAGATAESSQTVVRSSSIVGGLATGVGLGLVWTPCAGPILGAITSLAVTTPGSLSTLLLVVVYSIGAGLPLLAIALGGRAALGRLRLRSASGWASRVFGVLVLVTAGLMAVGADTAISADLVSAVPDWTGTLQTLERADPVQNALRQLEGNGGSSGQIADSGQADSSSAPSAPATQSPAASDSAASDAKDPSAPEFTGIDHWLNSQPLTISGLRGKVVLVDFWTYSCINCIRTLPYVEGWYQHYAADGLVIVGVHTPEFAFEHDTGNVQAAISRYGITYPVAQDNEYATWNAYGNEYWPADYLIDANGKIVSTHFGEGNYDGTEAEIRMLLAQAGQSALPTPSTSTAPNVFVPGETSETYLGTERGQSLVGGEPGNGVHSGTFPPPIDLDPDLFALNGAFDFEPQYIQSTAAGNQLEMSFYARDVYLVMSADTPSAVSVDVKLATPGAATSSPTEDMGPNGSLTVSSARLYHLVHFSTDARAILTITFQEAGVRAFAFTFGG